MAAIDIDLTSIPELVGAAAVAYELAREDIAVFRVDPCTKKPTVSDWDGASTADMEKAVSMFWQTPKAGVAIDCSKSGFVVIDPDRHPGAPDGVAAFDGIVPPDVDCWTIPTVETPNGGCHLYFKQPDGEEFGNSRGSLPAGIDVRGKGGYVVAPGTKNGSGEWKHVEGTPPIWEAPPLPEWLASYLRRKPQENIENQTREQSRATPGKRERAYAQAALERITNELRGVRHGGRNIALNTAALKLGHLVASGWLSQADAENALIESCRANGSWGENHAECEATIASGMTAGMKSPHAPLQDRKYDSETGEIFEDEPKTGEAQQKSKLLRWLGDDPLEPPQYLANEVLPETGVAIMGGQWAAGKTFAANNLSAAVMTGTPFAGAEIYRRGGVLWLAAEGENEIDARMAAAIAATPLPDGVLTHPQMPFCVQQNEVPGLTDGDAFKGLCAFTDEATAGMRERFNTDLALIVIDTLAAASGFDDENSASETQYVMNVLRRLSKHTKALVLVIDHYGKLTETGVRGSSAKSGAADAILAVLADKAFEGTITNRRMAVVKLRSGPTGAVMPFALKTVPIADSGGTTCVIEWSGETSKTVPVKGERSPWVGKGKLLKKAIEVAMIENGKEMSPFGGDGPRVKAVDRKKVRDEFYAGYSADGDSKTKQDTKRRTFGRLMDDALEKSLIATREINGTDWVWLVSEDDAGGDATQT